MKIFQTSLVRIFLLLALGILSIGNVYWYVERQDTIGRLAEAKYLIRQNDALIKQDAKESEATAHLSHRLQLPSDRITLSQDLNRLAQKLDLLQLDFKVTPEQPVENDRFANFGRSIVTLDIQNQNDSAIYSLILNVANEFPGAIRPIELSIARDPLSPSPLIKGVFQYEWIKSRKAGES